MTLQEKVGQYVEANETTMGAVADKLGISRSSLFNKLRGSNEFSLSEAFNLSRIHTRPHARGCIPLQRSATPRCACNRR